MKKLLITALALGASLSACTSEVEVETPSQSNEAPKAELVSFNVSGMT